MGSSDTMVDCATIACLMELMLLISNIKFFQVSTRPSYDLDVPNYIQYDRNSYLIAMIYVHFERIKEVLYELIGINFSTS